MNEKLHTSESSQAPEFESNNSIEKLKELLNRPVGAQNGIVIIKICIKSRERKC